MSGGKQPASPGVVIAESSVFEGARSVLSERAPIDREGALELNDGEPEQDERGSGGTSSPERVLERIQALPSVEGLVTLGSEDAPVCSDGICF